MSKLEFEYKQVRSAGEEPWFGRAEGHAGLQGGDLPKHREEGRPVHQPLVEGVAPTDKQEEKEEGRKRETGGTPAPNMFTLPHKTSPRGGIVFSFPRKGSRHVFLLKKSQHDKYLRRYLSLKE